jgi:hypothetical protein
MLENLCTVGSPWIVLNFANSNLTQEWFRPLHISDRYPEIGSLIRNSVLDESDATCQPREFG